MNEQGTGERIVRLELKYCECCGGLLLRRTGGEAVYCGSCARKINELPVKETVGRRTRNPHASCAKVGHPSRMGPKSVRVEAAEDRRLG